MENALEHRKIGRPKRTTPKTEEELESERLRALEATHKWRERQKAMRALQAVIDKGDAEEIIKGIIDKPKDIFEELRPLAIKAVKDVLKGGREAERLKAANIVLDRTNPKTQPVNLEVTIHPVDLSAFRLLPKPPQTNDIIDVDFALLPDKT